MAKTRNGLYLHVAWLAKLMSGDVTCQWGTWFKVHHDYTRRPSDFSLVAWTADHTRFLKEVVAARSKLGEKCFQEGQNQFRVKTKGGMVITGKPDLVTVDPKDRYAVYECKTGNPKNADVMQLMLYMTLLPQTPLCTGRSLDGHLIYRVGHKQDIPNTAIDTTFKDNAKYFVGILEGNEPLARLPSPYECRFCDIPVEECRERFEAVFPEPEPPEVSW